MSLVRTALRLATIKAIKGQTYAQGRVSDSSIMALSAVIEKTAKPVAVVYTDDDDFQIQGRDLWTPESGRSAIVILMSVASSVQTGNDVVVELPHTDQAMELTLDIMERQIKELLLSPRSPWGEMWRRLTMTVTRWRSMRGQSDSEGNRFASRQIIIDLEPVGEPEPGGALNPIWTDFLAMVEADDDPDFAPMAALLGQYLRGEPLTEFEQIQQSQGLTRAGAAAMGVGPFPGSANDDEAPPTFSQIQIDPLGLIETAPDEDDGA